MLPAQCQAQLPADGDHSLLYRSSDRAANYETNHRAAVKIDTTAPSTTDDYNGLSCRRVVVTLTPTDATSGVASTMYRIDGGPWLSGTAVKLVRGIKHKLPGLPAGAHLVQYCSTDNAGLVESVKSCTVTLM